MIENKLGHKLSALNGLSVRLGSLEKKEGWRYNFVEEDRLLSFGSLASLFDTGIDGKNKDDSGNKEHNNYSDFISGFQNAVTNFSKQLKDKEYRGKDDKLTMKTVFKKYSSVVKDFHQITDGIKNIYSPSVTTSFDNQSNIFEQKEARNNNSLLSTGSSLYGWRGKMDDAKNTLLSLGDGLRFQSNAKAGGPLLDVDSLKRVYPKENRIQEKPSFTIHQTFGDIVVQPASMDVSMQQLKVKIQDILKQARDTMY